MSRTGPGFVSVADAAAAALAALNGGTPVALVTLVTVPGGESVGPRLLVTSHSVNGALGSADLDERAVELARAALASGGGGLHELEVDSGVWGIFIEVQRAPPQLVIVGAGHIARPLCRIAALMGFDVTVMDDRPEFASSDWFPEAAGVRVVDFSDAFRDVKIGPDSYVVLVTRGHKYDYDCIQQLLALGARPAYVGMIGSRRRVRAAFEALVRDGADTERLRQVHAPIGLDIGAETPEEIALAIAAELVAVRRGGAGGSLKEQEDVLRRVGGTRNSEAGNG